MSRSSATAVGRGPAAFQEIGREEKRRFILNAAAAIFGAKGFHATTIKDIAEAAGIAHGTFYLYFKDKKDVYLALYTEFRTRIMEAILPGGQAGILRAGTDLPALVRRRLSALATLFESEEALARVFVYRTPGTDPQFEEQRREFVEHMTDAIAAVMRSGAEAGLFRRHDPRVAAMCLVGSIEMVIESWLQSDGAAKRPSLASMIEEAAGFFLPALLTAKAWKVSEPQAGRPRGGRRRKG